MRVTDPPWQKVVGPPGVMTAVGNEFTITAWLAELVHPLALVTVTVYVPLTETDIAAKVDAVDH